MSYKETKLYSILQNRCPRCHEGKFFESDNPYELKRWSNMNPRCPVCNEDFKRETGFYFGATYVSYALTVAFGVGLYILLGVLLNFSVPAFLITFSLLLVVLLPVFYRSARLTWINFFVPFRPKKKD